MHTTDNLIGKQFGPYRITGQVGRGGMGAVYRAFQSAVERDVALKVLPRDLAEDPHYVARFRQEAKILARLQHPHILPIYDFGEQEGYTYLVMALIEGGTLTRRLTGRQVPWAEVRRTLAEVGAALDFAHGQNIIHRDLKPTNILLDPRGHCLLADFGIAKLVTGAAPKTDTGLIVGTPQYMSPEQVRGEKLDHRSDLYALGIIVYEMATGRVPFISETPLALALKQVSEEPPPPRALNPQISEAMAQVLLRALHKDRNQRFQSANAFLLTLEMALAAQPTVPRFTFPAWMGRAAAQTSVPKTGPLQMRPAVPAASAAAVASAAATAPTQLHTPPAPTDLTATLTLSPLTVWGARVAQGVVQAKQKLGQTPWLWVGGGSLASLIVGAAFCGTALFTVAAAMHQGAPNTPALTVAPGAITRLRASPTPLVTGTPAPSATPVPSLTSSPIRIEGTAVRRLPLTPQPSATATQVSTQVKLPTSVPPTAVPLPTNTPKPGGGVTPVPPSATRLPTSLPTTPTATRISPVPPTATPSVVPSRTPRPSPTACNSTTTDCNTPLPSPFPTVTLLPTTAAPPPTNTFTPVPPPTITPTTTPPPTDPPEPTFMPPTETQDPCLPIPLWPPPTPCA